MKNRVRSLSMQWAVMTGLAALALSGKASAQFIGAEPRAAYVRGASDPIHKGDVVLRDLDVSLIGAAGHTGIFLGALTAGGPPMVVEAMNEPLQPNSGERAASGHFMNPASVLVQQQSVQINPFHTQFNEKGEIVQLGFVRPRGDAPRRKDGTYEWLRYYGARFGLRVHQEVSRGWQWSTRQQLSQLADWAVRERSFGTEYDVLGTRTLYGFIRDVCVRFAVVNPGRRVTCLETVRTRFSGRFRCDTLVTAFWNCTNQCTSVGRSPNAWMGGGMRWMHVEFDPSRTPTRLQTPYRTSLAFQHLRPATRPFEEGNP